MFEYLPIVIGTKSRFRLQIARKYISNFRVLAANIDEKKIRRRAPHNLTIAIAEAKADTIVEMLKCEGVEAIVVTADQVMLNRGEILEKPESAAEVKRRLQMYPQGNPATVSAICVHNMFTGQRVVGCERTAFTVLPFDDQEIQYICDDSLTYETCGALPSGLPGNLVCDLIDKHKVIPPGKYESVQAMPMDMVESLIQAVSYQSPLRYATIQRA